MTERLLEEALQAWTKDIQPDLSSRSRIQARLATPPPRSRLVPVAATAAAVVAVLGAIGFATSGLGAGARPGQFGAASADPVPIASAPLDPRTDVPAYRRTRPVGEPELVYVRATTGEVVARVATDAEAGQKDAVLSADGRRIFTTWNGGRDLGYLDVLTGRRYHLVSRPGQMVGITVSADGSTLAYEWVPRVDGNTSAASVVVHDLRSGDERVLNGVHAGPQILPLALSPDGSTLAVVPTDAFPRRLLLVPIATGFPQAQTVTGTPCSRGTANADQPRWSAAGLFVVQHCAEGSGSVTTSDLARVDPDTLRAERELHVTPVAATLLFAVVQDHHGQALFVTADESEPDHTQVVVRDPSDPTVSRVLTGLSALAVGGAE